MAAYSSTYNSRTIRRGQNRVRVQTQDGFGPITKTLLLVLVVGTLGLMYLTQITKTSAYGYKIDKLEAKRTALVTENESLRVEAARLQSIERVRGSEFAANLTSDGDVSFANN
jgi:cell division protein FtsL